MDARPLKQDLAYSDTNFVIGFGLAIASGVVLGVLIGWYRRLAMVFEPFLNALYATPRVAMIPLIIIWFGIGMWSKVFIVFINAFFPMLINTIGGVGPPTRICCGPREPSAPPTGRSSRPWRFPERCRSSSPASGSRWRWG